MDWSAIGSLQFEKPEIDSFPCLKLALVAGKKGGTYPAALCGADEAAVALFLDGSISFTEIPHLIEKVLDKHINNTQPDIEEIYQAEQEARKTAYSFAGGIK
jgi:1-deoxy-D-xylulose-5-phosphate reductoisomerase